MSLEFSPTQIHYADDLTNMELESAVQSLPFVFNIYEGRIKLATPREC